MKDGKLPLLNHQKFHISHETRRTPEDICCSATNNARVNLDDIVLEQKYYFALFNFMHNSLDIYLVLYL